MVLILYFEDDMFVSTPFHSGEKVKSVILGLNIYAFYSKAIKYNTAKYSLVVGVWLVWVGLVWRFFLGSLVVGAGAVVSLASGVLVGVRHDYSG